ncbi:hypothetical protein [Sulfurospirillum multivorans]|nr:hypothetical protein [Sulfurospirillum multivorans]
MCQKAPDVFSCPDGFTYDADVKQCVKPLDCPSGGTYSVERNRCEYPRIYECPTGYTLSGDTCIAPPVCPSGATFDATILKCTVDPTFACVDAGWTFNSTTQMCEKDPACIVGTYSKTYDKCLLAYTPTCATGYTYNSTRLRCEKTPPDCPSGTAYNATTNRCEQGNGSACTISGGTWNGTNCTVGSNYTATETHAGTNIGFVTSYNYRFKGSTKATTYKNNNSYTTYLLIVGDNNEQGMTYVGPIYTVLPNQTITLPLNKKTMHYYVSVNIIELVNNPSDMQITINGEEENSYIKNLTSYDIIPYFNGSYFWTTYSGIISPSATRTYITSYTPTSYFRSLSATATYICPNGGTLSGTTCNNTTTVAPSCPTGYTHDGLGKCYANPTCPSSGSFDGNLDMCWLSFNKSCTMGTYDATSNSCLNEPICDGGALNTTLDKCQMSREIVCAQGTKDTTTGKCTFTATCQSGATLLISGCNTEAIPLTCPSGTDTTLDVCYSDVNACKVDSTYPKVSTLTYSDALNICIVDENVVCASSLTWSELYQKCEAVPICYNGMYNPENDFCYISTKECPINAAYPCNGPIGNQWCSPYTCNATTNQCGYAECPGGIQPSLTAEMSPSYNADLVYSAADVLCTDSYCNLANSSRFTYCGLEAACPSGFGVFEQNGQCFVRECPQDSFQENNKCYSLGCPKGTTEQGNSKCLVN